MPFKMAIHTIIFTLRERNTLINVLTAPNTPTLSAYNFSINPTQTATTLKTKTQKQSQLLQQIRGKPTTQKVQANKRIQFKASPKEKSALNTKTGKIKAQREKEWNLREKSPWAEGSNPALGMYTSVLSPNKLIFWKL